MIEYRHHERPPADEREADELDRVANLAHRLRRHLEEADFFYALSDSTGVIAEVERGGTTANNHDLKDLWKTHIATNANHLFLVVPNELFNEAGKVRERPFPKVVRRMGAFFQSERSHVDVLSVHVFGY